MDVRLSSSRGAACSLGHIWRLARHDCPCLTPGSHGTGREVRGGGAGLLPPNGSQD